jgi:Raf kinase inhibitor-like YbhB/YbcL family protein
VHHVYSSSQRKEERDFMQTENIMTVWTDAIANDGSFDPRYTCDLDNSSPELRWENVPEGTVGFALIAEDPDARNGVFTHWVIYNIPPDVRHLPAGIPPQEALPNGIRQGVNSYGKLGYAGPCPPMEDSPHRYVFRLFALSQLPALPSRLRRDDLLSSIEALILSESATEGRYQRHIQKAG